MALFYCVLWKNALIDLKNTVWDGRLGMGWCIVMYWENEALWCGCSVPVAESYDLPAMGTTWQQMSPFFARGGDNAACSQILWAVWLLLSNWLKQEPFSADLHFLF